MKLLDQTGPYQLVLYKDGYYAVDYQTDSVGRSIIFSKDKMKVENKYNEIVNGGVVSNGTNNSEV
ncbi:hypothetical protein ACWA2C_16400 [Priestia megaterium]